MRWFTSDLLNFSVERIAIIGGDGVIGCRLIKFWRETGLEVITTTRRQTTSQAEVVLLDLASPQFGQLLRWRPQLAFICAAVTSVRLCETNDYLADLVNCQNTIKLIQLLTGIDCFTVLLSTNLVFDGMHRSPTESDLPNPLTKYGRSKAQAETIALSMQGTAVVRLTKVLSAETRLLQEWRNYWRKGWAINVYSNAFCAPVGIQQVVTGLSQIGMERAHGVWHFSSPDEIAYTEMAKLYATEFGVSLDLVCGIETTVPYLAERHAGLSTAATGRRFGWSFPRASEVVRLTARETNMINQM